MRINRYLALGGVASRRGADELIAAGKVRINGVVVTNLATQVEPGKDNVEVGGRTVRTSSGHIYLILHKPPGCDVTRDDPHSRSSVFKYLPQDLPNSVQYAGRLDRDTTGLLLFTNDGEFANAITHPSHGVEKEYLCFGPNAPTSEQLKKLVRIIHLDDGPARAKSADMIRAHIPQGLSKPKETLSPFALRIILHLGRKRIVRRMCEAVGFRLKYLHRTRIGPLELGNLAMGKFRALKASELDELRQASKSNRRPRSS